MVSVYQGKGTKERTGGQGTHETRRDAAMGSWPSDTSMKRRNENDKDTDNFLVTVCMHPVKHPN
jgi:hypothetical protein